MCIGCYIVLMSAQAKNKRGRSPKSKICLGRKWDAENLHEEYLGMYGKLFIVFLSVCLPVCLSVTQSCWMIIVYPCISI
jgi:hypothetical protein